MNVLRVIANMKPSSGGPCEGIRNSIPELEKLGVHNEVVSLDEPDAQYLKEDKFTIYALGPGKAPWSYNAKLIPWLIEHMGRFDVVIVHGLWLYPSYAVFKAIQKLKSRHKTSTVKNGKVPKFFIMPHGMLDPYFQAAPDRKLKALRNSLYWKLIEGRVVNEADGLLFTCETELKLAREPFRPYQPKREINIGYGIAKPPPYTPSMQLAFLQHCQALDNGAYWLFLSRIHEKKGLEFLIKAYASLLQKKANVGKEIPKIVIAGPGLETDFGKKIQTQVSKSHALRNAVFFTGMLSGDAKWGALYGCEAFILPSHQENFGIAVVEALACSKPVLISDQVNIWPEIAVFGGGVIAPDSLEGIYGMLETWLQKSAEEKMQIGKGALSSFESKFSIGPAAKQLLAGVNF